MSKKSIFVIGYVVAGAIVMATALTMTYAPKTLVVADNYVDKKNP